MFVATLALVVLVAPTDSGRPPTLDPTYGMPLPKVQVAQGQRQKDAKWIWASTVSDTQAIWCRRSVRLSHAPVRARLFVTADNFFEAYVDGQAVGSTRSDPSDGNVWSQVRVFDVKANLSSGNNLIAIKGQNAGGAAGLLVRLEVDGKPVLLSDNSWRLTDREPASDWQSATFDDSSWTAATVESEVGEGIWGGQLTGWPVALNTTAAYLAHLKLSPVSICTDGSLVRWTPAKESLVLKRPDGVDKPWSVTIDFGKELTGRTVVTSSNAVRVKIGTGESAEESVEKPWTTAEADLGQNPGYSPYTAMRYTTLTFPAETSSATVRVSLDHLYYPVVYRGSFDCSDPLLTKVWYTGAYTAHLCMQEDIWDAPKRDRARWMGDLHISGEVINNAFLDTFLMEQTMDRLRSEAQGGRPESELPGGNVNGIPGYSCAWIAGLADFYRHTGDMAYLQKQLPRLVTMLEFLRMEIGDDGIFANKHGQWPFVDWAPEFNGDTPQARAATHLFLVKAVRDAASLFREVGDGNRFLKYDMWASQLTRAAQQKLVENGTFGDRRQENAMAIYSGVATPDQVAAIYREVLRPDSPAWGYVATPYYNNYILDAITQSGHMDDAMKFVRTYWGGMLAEGATSWWEGYDPSWPKEHFHAHLQADNGTGYFVSLSHGWSAGPTNWLTERVLGVRPTGGGFRSFDVNPNLGDLAWASGTVPTPSGPIKVRVDRTGSQYRVVVAVPKGLQGRLGNHVLKEGTQTVQVTAQ
ncbi:MAG: alpha-L-rhamnosidase C-terminal domain-containing protein [Fimbriimonas sp.]|nr:alpha-L-rhamnosidase C-terminal domain-containing protein [Fimbriimonas sp.]